MCRACYNNYANVIVVVDKLYVHPSARLYDANSTVNEKVLAIRKLSRPLLVSLYSEVSLSTASPYIAIVQNGFSWITPAILNRSRWNFTKWWVSDRTLPWKLWTPWANGGQNCPGKIFVRETFLSVKFGNNTWIDVVINHLPHAKNDFWGLLYCY